MHPRFCLVGLVGGEDMAKGRGRPGKYTPECVNKILDAIRNGNYAYRAAALAGINQDTYYRWLKMYPEFSEAVSLAESECQQAILNNIMQFSKSDPDIGFRFLARRFPAEWGEKAASKVEHSGTITHNGAIQFVNAHAAITEITSRSSSDS